MTYEHIHELLQHLLEGAPQHLMAPVANAIAEELLFSPPANAVVVRLADSGPIHHAFGDHIAGVETYRSS